jgi:HTH-type transcriptional regulator/antitoxin HipB
MAVPGENIPYGKVITAREIGALVRRRRTEGAGVLQANAAALAGVGLRFLSELERGKETAELGKVLQVLERIGLEVWIVPRGAGALPSMPVQAPVPGSDG